MAQRVGAIGGCSRGCRSRPRSRAARWGANRSLTGLLTALLFLTRGGSADVAAGGWSVAVPLGPYAGARYHPAPCHGAQPAAERVCPHEQEFDSVGPPLHHSVGEDTLLFTREGRWSPSIASRHISRGLGEAVPFCSVPEGGESH